ncbi:MAG: tyrosine-type recombinase/integrase [Butyrivibrio sp.]|nr:tyrosine-type recombinase/integrase [Butyrivibrio sp.]
MTPKTWHGMRTIPLNEDIIEVIEHQKAINRFLDGDKITSIHETIFKAPQRGLLMATPADREIGRICKRNSIDKFTAHAFRATFATRCIEQGIEPRTLQELLGHADFGLTMNLYGHVTNDTLENAMSKIKIAI